jgi:hypothetical protein
MITLILRLKDVKELSVIVCLLLVAEHNCMQSICYSANRSFCSQTSTGAIRLAGGMGGGAVRAREGWGNCCSGASLYLTSITSSGLREHFPVIMASTARLA